MAVRMKDMTRGKPLGLIVSFALPLMVGNIFQQLYLVMDTAVVGKALGVDALAALGACDWLNWVMLGIIQGITQGFSIPMAQLFGARKENELRQVVGCSLILSALCAVGLVVLGQTMLLPMLRLLNTPVAIQADAMSYLRVIYAGLPIVMAYNLFACVLRALGDGQTPLRAMVVASFTNIGLDLLFVLKFHWGIGGAALATVIAQGCSSIFCLYYIVRNPILRLHRGDFVLPRHRVVRLFRLGTPMGIQNLMIAAGGMIVQSVANQFGVSFLGGYTAANKLYGLMEAAACAYGYAMVTYVGQNAGAGHFRRVRSGFRWAMLVALLTSVAIMVTLLVFGRPILSCFISGTPQEVEDSMKIAYYNLAVMSSALPLLYTLYVARSATQGLGNTVLPMVSGVAELAFRTVTSLTLPRIIGPIGICYPEIMAWLGSTLVLVPSYFVTVRKAEKTGGVLEK